MALKPYLYAPPNLGLYDTNDQFYSKTVISFDKSINHFSKISLEVVRKILMKKLNLA